MPLPLLAALGPTEGAGVAATNSGAGGGSMGLLDILKGMGMGGGGMPGADSGKEQAAPKVTPMYSMHGGGGGLSAPLGAGRR